MKTKKRKMLPKTMDEISNGGIYPQRVRCGKQNCRCMNGHPHLAFYFFFRRSGKLTKIYIRRDEIKAFSAIVSDACEKRRSLREAKKESLNHLKQLRQLLRETNLALKEFAY